jgi:molybdate transport system substrate-binding protein
MRACFSAILLFSIFFLPASAQGAEIRLIAANAVKEPLIELFQAFEKASGHTVVALWAGTEAATKRVTSGEVVDVVVIAAPNIERLIADGKLAAGSRTDFAKSGVGVAVRDGLPKPDISSVAALKEALLAAKSIAYSQGPSGAYIARLIEKLGIAEQIKDKVHRTPSGVQVAEFVAKGGADLGFQQISELVHVKGIHYLGPLPSEVQNIATYTAALHASAPAVEAAIALLKFLASAEAKAILRKSSMEPAS